MAPSEDEIRRRLAEFAARWGGYDGSEVAEAQTFLNQLLECYGVDRQAAGARFEDTSAGGFMDMFWPGVCIVEMKRPSEVDKLPSHRKQALDYSQRSGTPKSPAPRWVVLCAFHRFEVWEPGAVYTEPRAIVDLVDLPDRLDVLNFLAGRNPVFEGASVDVTREAVVLVTELYQRLQDREAADLPVLRDFVLQSVWAMFAEDIHMLPSHVFTRVAQELAGDPSRSSADDLGRLFEILATKGRRPEHGSTRECRTRTARSSRGRRAFISSRKRSHCSFKQRPNSTGARWSPRSSAGCCKERSARSGSGHSARTTRTRPTS